MTFLEIFTLVSGGIILVSAFLLFIHLRKEDRKLIDYRNNLRDPKNFTGHDKY